MVSALLAISAVLGLVFGSFANVLIYRLPRGVSIVSPGSHCPRCGTAIPWYHNIPVLAWIFLLGKCGKCKEPISLRYPLVEISMCLLFALSAWFFGPSLVDVSTACLVCFLLLVLGIIDLEHYLLLDVLTYPGIALGFALSFFVGWTDWIGSLTGALIGAAIPWLLLVFWSTVMKEEGMGWGDVKYLAMIGAFLGWKGVLITLILGSLIGSLFGLLGMILRRFDRKTALPFGTFLSISGIVSLFFQQAIWALYMGLFPGYSP